MKKTLLFVWTFVLFCNSFYLFAADYYVLSGATDPGDYNNCNGSYYYSADDSPINGRNVYKHDTYEFYIWYDSPFWAIDKDLIAGVSGYFEEVASITPPEGSWARDTASGDNPTLTKTTNTPSIVFTNGANAALNFQQVAGTALENNWLCGQFSITATETGATLNSITVTLGGTYDAGDLASNPFQLYVSNTNNFATASTLGSTFADPGSGSNLTFNLLSDELPAVSRYYWVTADLSETVTSDDNMNGVIDSSSDLNISSGTISGSSTYGKLNAGGDATLPVELSSFNAVSDGKSVFLKWTTASEVDNLGFILERSKNNKDWVIVASYQTHDSLKGKGNNPFSTNYNFTDNSVITGITFQYKLSDVNMNGDINTFPAITVKKNFLPVSFRMDNAYPNPFNPETCIVYHLPQESQVSIIVYDITGRSVVVLVDDLQSAGSYSVNWEGSSDNGTPMPSGVYLVCMNAGNKLLVQKVLMIK